jgi:hypothetical protein
MPHEQPVDLSNAADSRQMLLDATVQALETMAFFCAQPTNPVDALPPEDAYRVSMDFKGPLAGTVDLIAGRFFGQRLASNALGCGVSDDEAVSRAEDSIRELINVVVGMIMPKLAKSDADVFDLSLPRTDRFDSAADWDQFAGQQDVCLIDAEGEALAIRVSRRA